MALDDIVSVQIDVQADAPTRVGFGIPLILTYHTKFLGRAQEYTSAADMLVAGGGPFVSTDMAYVLSNAAFSQNPRPSKVVVGRRANASTRTVTLTPVTDATEGKPFPTTDYDVVINGTTFTYTTDATPTAAEITLGLTAAINGGTEDVVATDLTGTMTIEAADSPGGTPTAGIPFTISRDRSLMELHDDTTDPGMAADLTAVQTENDSWYAVVADVWGEAEIDALATAIQSQDKFHSAATQDDDVFDTGGSPTDIGTNLSVKSYTRTSMFYHADPHEGIAAAYLGKNLPQDPGSITWKFKELSGQTPSVLTATERTELVERNMERYTEIANGLRRTCDGATLDGQFIDITRFVDWLKVRLQERLVTQLANLKKIPFTDAGIAIVENEVRAQLQEGITVGGLSPDPHPNAEANEPYLVTLPRAQDVSAIDKANRCLPDVTFDAILAGAIHKVQIQGTVSV